MRALGSPEAAAERLLKQTLEEFMSTRLGSRKEAEVVSASQREVDGRLFYDVEVRNRHSAGAQPSRCNSATLAPGNAVLGASVELDRASRACVRGESRVRPFIWRSAPEP